MLLGPTSTVRGRRSNLALNDRPKVSRPQAPAYFPQLTYSFQCPALYCTSARHSPIITKETGFSVRYGFDMPLYRCIWHPSRAPLNLPDLPDYFLLATYSRPSCLLPKRLGEEADPTASSP